MVVTIQGAKEVEAPQKALPQKAFPKTPVTAVAAQGAQEVKQGVLQDPHPTTTKIPKDLQTQFWLVLSVFCDGFGMLLCCFCMVL